MPHGEVPKFGTVMDRRRFLLAVGAALPALTLTGCGGATDEGSFREMGIFFDATSLSMVDVLSDMMIPETDTLGARAVDAAGFVDAMMAGWATADTRANVKATLEWLDSSARSGHGGAFLMIHPTRQRDLVTHLDLVAFDAEADLPTAAARGYRSLKQVVYLGYYLSETGATQELRYEFVPGAFRGCVPLADIGRTWAV